MGVSQAQKGILNNAFLIVILLLDLQKKLRKEGSKHATLYWMPASKPCMYLLKMAYINAISDESTHNVSEDRFQKAY